MFARKKIIKSKTCSSFCFGTYGKKHREQSKRRDNKRENAGMSRNWSEKPGENFYFQIVQNHPPSTFFSLEFSDIFSIILFFSRGFNFFKIFQELVCGNFCQKKN